MCLPLLCGTYLKSFSVKTFHLEVVVCGFYFPLQVGFFPGSSCAEWLETIFWTFQLQCCEVLGSCLDPAENADISVLVGGPHHGPVVPCVGCAAVLVSESVVLLGSVLCAAQCSSLELSYRSPWFTAQDPSPRACSTVSPGQVPL